LLIFGIFHLLNNWKPITNYIISKSTGMLNQKGNMAIVAALSLVIIVTGIFALPPTQWIMDLGGQIKDMWVTAPQFEPPFGHAEELSLAGFCRRMYIDLAGAQQALDQAGIAVDSHQQSLAEIALANGTRPMDVYMVIKHLEQTPQLSATTTISRAEVEDVYGPGSGSGRKSVAEIAESIDVDLETALARLEAAGIVATSESLLKDLKDAHQEISTAAELVMIMLAIAE